MREAFERWFDKEYPGGMDLDGPTAVDEWSKWQVAFFEGRIYQLRIEVESMKKLGVLHD